ncbi:MAG: alanine--glyoxylate aminotransferase family protein [Acidobacteria bacterium]|nr:alanine--glyoxylate aminotransferase family protein [Acidobacteriota bacterium]
MEGRQYLQVPGPTNIPDRILRSLSQPLINHRGPEFSALVEACLHGLQRIFRTSRDVLIFPGSGSGALESVIANLFSPGDRIAAVSMGLFSERMAVIAEKHGLVVRRLAKEWGQSVGAGEIVRMLEGDRQIRAVCLPQNETTSGVVTDVRSIARELRESGHPALLIVDAISSLACMPLETDAWGIDVVVSASQKGLMLPPGLGLVTLGPRAWQMAEASTMARWYWDYGAMQKRLRDRQFPYTPATTLLFGLRESIALLEEEGLEKVWRRHSRIAGAVRSGVAAMGLSLLAERGCESDAITAVRMPDGIPYARLAEILRATYRVIIGEGLERLRDRIFRIGHMGAIHEPEVFAVMGSVELALHEAGFRVEPGSANAAVGRFLAVKPQPE